MSPRTQTRNLPPAPSSLPGRKPFRFAPPPGLALSVLALSALALSALAIFGGPVKAEEPPSEAPGISLSSEEDLLRDAREGPCDNHRRLEAVRNAFTEAGANPDAVVLDRFKRVKNLRIEKPGRSSEAIVVSAHWDKVGGGCGAVDNWTGITAIAHIFRTLASIPTEKTLVFVAFGREEDGLLGSRAMARSIPKDERSRYCAVVNLDSLGVTRPQVGRNLSSKELTRAASDLAERMNIPFDDANVAGNSDSTPFLDRDIPALTLHGLPENYREIIHTPRDQAERIDSRSLYLAYRLALGLVAEIDRAPCDSWR